MNPAQDNSQPETVPAESVQSGEVNIPDAAPIPLTPAPPPESENVQPVANPPESVLSPTESLTQTPKKHFNVLGVFIFVLLLILVGGTASAYAVAYEKITLDKYPQFQKAVSNFVISLPFMPKTPKYLLEKTAIAHQDVTKQSFDISLAMDSPGIASSLGLTQIDFLAKGVIDYSNPKDVLITSDISVTKDLNFEVKKKDQFLYFRVNKLPTTIFTLIGISAGSFDPVLGKWVSYDTTPLQTEARKIITEDKEVDPLSEEFLDENFSKYIDSEVLSKLILTETQESGFEVYKISLSADPELIDHLGKKIDEETVKSGELYLNQNTQPQKLSDTIKKLEWEIYIDKKEFYTRKTSLLVDVKINDSESIDFLPGIGTGTENQDVSFVFVAKAGNFGEDVNISTPETAMNFEEFTALLTQIVTQIYTPTESLAP